MSSKFNLISFQMNPYGTPAPFPNIVALGRELLAPHMVQLDLVALTLLLSEGSPMFSGHSAWAAKVCPAQTYCEYPGMAPMLLLGKRGGG